MCGKKNIILEKNCDVKEERIEFWLSNVDYIFYTPLFEEFFHIRGYNKEYFEDMKNWFKRLFDNKIVGKGVYKEEPFLFFRENYYHLGRNFQIMFFKREKERRYLTYCSERLSGGFLIEYPRAKGTVLVEGPMDAVTLSFVFYKNEIPLRVFSAFGYHRTIMILKTFWPLLWPFYSFFDADVKNPPFIKGFEVYDFLKIKDPDDLARLDKESLKRFVDYVKEIIK